MKEGLIDVDWDNIDKMNEEEITYFLFLEGKSKKTIAQIRRLTVEEVERHLIEGKIKHGIVAKCKNSEELLKTLEKTPKLDKLNVLQSLTEELKESLLAYIRREYGNLLTSEKVISIWIIGELKREDFIDILKKGVVHKHVNVRRMAVSAATKIGTIECEDILIRGIMDPNPQVVQYSIKGLTKIKSKKCYEKILNIIKTTDKEYLKNASEKYLEEFKGW